MTLTTPTIPHPDIRMEHKHTKRLISPTSEESGEHDRKRTQLDPAEGATASASDACEDADNIKYHPEEINCNSIGIAPSSPISTNTGLNSLPDELVLQIASYLPDRTSFFSTALRNLCLGSQKFRSIGQEVLYRHPRLTEGRYGPYNDDQIYEARPRGV
ncbi:hypothetical protein BDV96DRAFT_577096 [Lophiotrema nucula]|uniref:F-box domain-containing protein n=1 Tax=Lophiotrema nucula TaxID=690887 RepID=A0A6A5Z8A7_9PLEO|nr:hypothetical protein BDV96DRAFT_577096 [Lophiotrema nucula]